MNTLVTPLQVLKLAFGEGEYLPPEIIAEADIAGAEQRHIVPVVGRALYEKLLAGSYPDFRTEYLASPAALFTRAVLQPLEDCCREAGVPVAGGHTMAQLGRACGIDVPTAAAALLAKEKPLPTE